MKCEKRVRNKECFIPGDTRPYSTDPVCNFRDIIKLLIWKFLLSVFLCDTFDSRTKERVPMGFSSMSPNVEVT